MATQTYEQLIAGANKIKENELPETNTHNLVGEQLLQMTNKMQEDSVINQEKLSELENDIDRVTLGVNNCIASSYPTELVECEEKKGFYKTDGSFTDGAQITSIIKNVSFGELYKVTINYTNYSKDILIIGYWKDDVLLSCGVTSNVEKTFKGDVCISVPIGINKISVTSDYGIAVKKGQPQNTSKLVDALDIQVHNSIELGDTYAQLGIDNLGKITKQDWDLTIVPVKPLTKYLLSAESFLSTTVGALGYSNGRKLAVGDTISSVKMENLQSERGYKVYTTNSTTNYLYINKKLWGSSAVIKQSTSNGFTYPTTIGEREIFKTLIENTTTSKVLLTKDKNIPTPYPIKGKFFISRILPIYEGKVTKLHTDFEVNSSMDLEVCVLTEETDGQYVLISKTPISITSKDTDISKYDISVPNGNSMVSLLIDSNKYPNVFNYADTKEYLDSYKSKAISVDDAIIGNKYSILNSFNYITPNFYFEIDAKVKIDIEEKEKDAYKDKTLVILGDSITWLSISGDGKKGWVTYFKEVLKFKKVINYARSGATWSNTSKTVKDIIENTGGLSDNNVIYNQVNRMLDDIEKGAEVPDYIMILAGTNDAWYPSSRPDALSKTAKEIFEDTSLNYLESVNINQCTSIAQAMRYVAEMLIKHCPNTQIVVCSPLQSTAFTNERNTLISEVIEQSANYMSWNYINQAKECGINRLQEIRGKYKTYDGTHTSEIGAKDVGTFLAAKCKAIFKL